MPNTEKMKRHWTQLLAKGLTVLESPVSSHHATNVIDAFELFIGQFAANCQFRASFEKILNDWSASRDNRTHFSEYYTPYFRNREAAKGYDEKIVWQYHDSFLDDLKAANLIDDVSLTSLRSLLNVAVKHNSPFIDKLIETEPNLAGRLLPLNAEQPIVIRLMRYLTSEKMATNPHIDKTALSNIIWNSDNLLSQCLVFSENEGDPISLFKKPGITHVKTAPSYVFFGGAIPSFSRNTQVKEAVHAVLPFHAEKYRYSFACFWLLSGHSMKSYVTKRASEDDVGILRSYER